MKQFEARKREHIQHSLDSAHQAFGLSGLESVHLFHDALPDLNFQEVRLNSTCLGQELQTPFYIAGMTAGHADAWTLNRVLAFGCAKRGWAMGVGSQRRDLEQISQNDFVGDYDRWHQLREEVPHLALFANIGISQLITAETQALKRLINVLSPQALVVHLNALQEVMQPEGTPLFRGGLLALRRCCEELGMPIVLKETGCGFSARTLEKLQDLPLAALDISGLGGTHWGRIEGARAQEGSLQSIASQTFANWGESTVESLLAAVRILPDLEIWASGGVRNGLDAAKLLALGAHRVGYAKPALEAALKGADALDLWMQTQEFELKVALFCTESQTCPEIRQKVKREGVWKRSDI